MVLSNKSAFEAHLAVIYTKMYFERFSVYLDMNTTQLVNCVSGQNPVLDASSTFTNNPEEFDIWARCYSVIRDLNVLIKLWPDATAFKDEEKDHVLGELKFLRAYAYFKLVRGYGGVPIVEEPMELPASGDVTELHQPRAKESDVWKFVEREMSEAIALLRGGDEFRINKWSALAFKSRAMMYAGSVARYSELQLNGILGLPASEAEDYFKSARDAAKQVIDEGPYELYNLHDDKAYNYHQMTFDETAANKERIFVTAYYWPLKTSPVDRNTAPYNHRSSEGYGSYVCVTLDMVDEYEYINNRDGSLKMKDESGNPIIYDKAIDIFQDKDPRFFATVLSPGSAWKGTFLQVYGNKIVNGEEVPGQGPDGIGQPEATSTGFCMARWSDPNPPRPIAGGSSEVDKQCIRYAEVLLNYAEAQLELDNEPEARIYINLIRDRAGIQELSTVTMDDLRRERYVELAYEDNCYWDWKRWRIFHIEMYARDTRG
ncbi:MAG: RagB/SusD family nutrient uptake outer membrane protein, partial [Bacteroidales bacterium]|nr:RagB/SusD family nutrient uptake outer membrane protein [Bacteroidales bacterium]